jgi:hypothetical protein
MLMGQHPEWTPDQVKGALMLTASPEKLVTQGQLGVGDVNIAKARSLKTTPPNPNAALNRFVATAADGTRVFDSAAWSDAAWASAAWASAAWSDAAWASAAWSSAAWSSAAWASAAWASAAWGTAAWSSAAWSDAAWSDAAWADNAGADPTVGLDPTAVDPATQDAVLAALGIIDPTCDPTIDICVLPDAPVGPPVDLPLVGPTPPALLP